jgi:hypothetical protein
MSLNTEDGGCPDGIPVGDLLSGPHLVLSALLVLVRCGHENRARADPYHSSGVNEQWMRDLAHLSAADPRPHPPSEPEGNAPGERREPIDAWTKEASSPGAGGARLHARGSQPTADAMLLPSPIRLHRRRRAASHEARDRWLGVCPWPEWERPPAAGGRREGDPWGEGS